MSNNTGLRLFQWGDESGGAAGTAVPATSKIAVRDIEFEETGVVNRPPLAKGLLVRNPGNETAISRGTNFHVPDTEVVFNQLQHWLSMTGLGSPAAGGDHNPGSSWTFTKSLTTPGTPKTFTIERRLTDGSSPVDHEWAYCFLQKFRLVYQVDQPLMFSADGVARRQQSSTLTNSLAMPTIVTNPSPLARIWINGSWNDLGVSQVTGQVLGATIEISTGLKPKMTLDGRTDLDFTTFVFDPKEFGVNVEITMMMGAQYAAEKVAAMAQDTRGIRLRILNASYYDLYLDMLLKYTNPDLFSVGSEDGQDVLTLSLQDATDGSNVFEASAYNTSAVYT